MKSEGRPIGKIRQRPTHSTYLVVASPQIEGNYGFKQTMVYTLVHMHIVQANATVPAYLDVAPCLCIQLYDADQQRPHMLVLQKLRVLHSHSPT